MADALRYYSLIACLTHSVLCQGPFQLTYSSNPVYSGESFTLTCGSWSGLQLVQVSIDAFNGTFKKGLLYYKVASQNSTGVGVFAGKSFDGYPNIPAAVTSVSVTLTASLSLELDYSCTASVVDGSDVPVGIQLISPPVTSNVYVCPSPPKFQLSPVVFNDSDSGFIFCESRNGKPAANVSITVNGASGGMSLAGNGSELAALNLSLPLSKWHNAVVTCYVTNHRNCSNWTVTSDVRINYIINTSVPEVIYRNESVVLNCSTYISYYPGVRYRWTVTPTANVTGSLYHEWITVPQEQIGSFWCTATNNVTMASVVIVFTVSNSSRPSTTANLSNSDCDLCWIAGLVLGITAVVIIAVVLGVLCKRGHFSKGRISTSGSPTHHSDLCASERSNVAKLHSVDQEYDSLDIQRSSEPTYAQLEL